MVPSRPTHDEEWRPSGSTRVWTASADRTWDVSTGDNDSVSMRTVNAQSVVGKGNHESTLR